ncbi:MAG: hypothetical protein EZS28_043118, partial [Streblomastix strix]
MHNRMLNQLKNQNIELDLNHKWVKGYSMSQLNAGKNVHAYEKAEDPQFAMEKGLSIDTTYYKQQQLEKPLSRLSTPVMRSGSVGELFKGAHSRVVRKPSQSAMTIKVTMGNFFSVGVNCICCHTPIRASVQNPEVQSLITELAAYISPHIQYFAQFAALFTGNFCIQWAAKHGCRIEASKRFIRSASIISRIMRKIVNQINGENNNKKERIKSEQRMEVL